MTTLTNICRYSIPKTSPRLMLISFNPPGTIHSVTTFPTSFNLLKHSVFLTQNNYNIVPGIQSATFATSIGRIQESSKGPQHNELNPTHIASDKNVDAFSKLEKAAKSESFHFQKKNKEQEDIPTELVPVSDDKSQGMISCRSNSIIHLVLLYVSNFTSFPANFMFQITCYHTQYGLKKKLRV